MTKVAMTWKEDHIPLHSHKYLALKCLQKTTAKLKSDNLYQVYDNILKPVIKQEGSTKVRPVFEASAREKSTPSLSQCLNCGPNLIEFNPSLLLRLRERKYGVSADIEKAFLQVFESLMGTLCVFYGGQKADN
ncbi:hypothetical protein AVEN_231362-1 [Araneus ventricosus]|uniref:Uncharacterized protein n=1 Tax=Araneus ventricosus TaxID=182803 RepID=A0A4Y2PEA6_ARAVE|nr:hypothetical protein AVEN_107183-1 [Araneus ventricosus]GBN49318.1 hypothetical protein AVEN_231362-1 [Araneus ventricosus]